MKVILASSSPNRKELLSRMGLKFDVVPPPKEIELKLPAKGYVDPKYLVMFNASNKADYVFKTMHNSIDQLIVIGADTVIVIDDKVIGKPSNSDEAYRILKYLSGRWHTVCTGLAIIAKINERVIRVVEYDDALVKFKELSEEEIKWYISTGEPIGAAGAYRIQGLGAWFIEEVKGNPYTVVGIPLHKLYMWLRKLGVLKH